MGIDGIGKGGGAIPPGPSNIAEPNASGSARSSFEAVRPASATSEASTIARVRAGELTVDAYLDAKVDEATSHLAGRLAPEQLAFVRQTLRDQLSTDPLLADLVKSVTGAVPRPSE